MENKVSLLVRQSDTDAVKTDALFADLQSLWDEQGTRIDRALALSDAAHRNDPPMRPHLSVPFRLRMLAAYVVLFVVSVAAAAYWGILLTSLAYTALALVAGLVIELIYICLVAECLYQAACLIILSPTRVGILRMSRHVRRSKAQGIGLGSTPMLQLRRVTSACIAAVIALTVASCTVTGIDDYTITQNHPGRAAAVETVSNIISQL